MAFAKSEFARARRLSELPDDTWMPEDAFQHGDTLDERATVVIDAARRIDLLFAESWREREIAAWSGAATAIETACAVARSPEVQTELPNVARVSPFAAFANESHGDRRPLLRAFQELPWASLAELGKQLEALADLVRQRRPDTHKALRLGPLKLFCFELYRAMAEPGRREELATYFREEFAIDIRREDLERHLLRLEEIALVVDELKERAPTMSEHTWRDRRDSAVDRVRKQIDAVHKAIAASTE